jgi:hypothetical protein
MGPDNFVRKNNNSAKPKHASQIPVGSVKPAHTQNFRPMQDFSPQPLHNFSPKQPHQSQPVMDGFRSPAVAPKLQHQTHKQSTLANTREPLTPQASTEVTNHKKKRRFPRPNRFAVSVFSMFLLVGAFSVLVATKNNDVKTEAKPPSIIPLVKPDFSAYYPNPLPDGLSTSNGSIVYTKNSFTFILKQGGKNSFFVSEQPAASDPNLSALKSKLVAPKALTLSVGQGIVGGLEAGTVSAVKTKTGTLIVVNCVNTNCATMPKLILSDMQATTQLDNLRQSNL